MKTETKNGLRPSILKPSWINPFGGFFRNDFKDWDLSLPETIPSLNIKEENDSYKVELAAPGLQKEDFNIAVEDGILTISCEKKSEKSEENNEGNFSRVEYNYSSFSRSLTLPENTDTAQMVAKYKDGILSMNIPKKRIKEKTPTQKIKVE